MAEKATELSIVIRARNAAREALDQVAGQLGNLNKFAERHGETLRRAGAAMTAFAAAGAASLALVTAQASKVEASMINVQKTTNLSAAEIKKLTGNFREMSREVPSSTAALGNVGAVAGQLSVKGVPNITAFTETVAKIATVTDYVEEQAATDLARLSNLFDLPIENVGRLGSVMNELENNTTATAPAIGDFAKRLAPASKQIGLAAAEVFGLSATLIDLGFNSETSGTAVSDTFSEMQRDAGAFGRQMGLTGAEFRRRLSQDAIGTITQWARAIKDLPAEQFISQLNEVGIAGSRARTVFTALAGGVGLLEKNVSIANEEFEKGTSLQREFETFMKSAENQTKLFDDAVANLAASFGELLLPVFKAVLSTGTALVNFLTELPDLIKVVILATGGAVTALAALAGVVGLLLGVLPLVVSGFNLLKGAVLAYSVTLPAATAVTAAMSDAMLGVGAASAASVTGLAAWKVTLGTLAVTLGQVGLAVGAMIAAWQASSAIAGIVQQEYAFKVPDSIKSAEPKIRARVMSLVEQMNSAMIQGGGNMKSQMAGLMAKLDDAVREADPRIRQDVREMMDGIGREVESKSPGIADSFRLFKFNSIQMFDELQRLILDRRIDLNDLLGFDNSKLLEFRARIEGAVVETQREIEKIKSGVDPLAPSLERAARGAQSLASGLGKAGDSAQKLSPVLRAAFEEIDKLNKDAGGKVLERAFPEEIKRLQYLRDVAIKNKQDVAEIDRQLAAARDALRTRSLEAEFDAIRSSQDAQERADAEKIALRTRQLEFEFDLIRSAQDARERDGEAAKEIAALADKARADLAKAADNEAAAENVRYQEKLKAFEGYRVKVKTMTFSAETERFRLFETIDRAEEIEYQTHVERLDAIEDKGIKRRLQEREKLSGEILKHVKLDADEQLDLDIEMLDEKYRAYNQTARDIARSDEDLVSIQTRIQQAYTGEVRETLERNIELRTRHNDDLKGLSNEQLLQVINSEKEVEHERIRHLQEFKSRSLSTYDAIRLGMAEYRIEAINAAKNVADFTLNSFKTMERGISSAFFNPVTGQFLNFKDGISGVFDSIKNAFFGMLADMAARLAVSGLLNLGSKLLGFASGGVIPEDGLFAGQKGEAVLTRDAVGLLGKGAISALNSGASASSGVAGVGGAGELTASEFATRASGEFASVFDKLGAGVNKLVTGFNKMFPGFSAPFAGAGATVGGIGASLLNSSLFGDGLGVQIGGTLGSLAGTLGAATISSAAFAAAGALAAPFTFGLSALAGGVLGGFFGSLFGGGETLNPDEEAFYPAFAQLQASRPDLRVSDFTPGGADIELIMAMTRLSHPNTGADSISDSFRLVGGLGIGEDEIDQFTRHGLRDIVARGIMTRQEMEDQMVLDMGIFKPGAKLDYMGAFGEGGIVSRPGFALVGESGPEAVIPLRSGRVPVEMRGGNDGAVTGLLARILDALERNRDAESEIVVKLDGRRLGEALLRLSRNGLPVVHARGVEGLAAS